MRESEYKRVEQIFDGEPPLKFKKTYEAVSRHGASKDGAAGENAQIEAHLYEFTHQKRMQAVKEESGNGEKNTQRYQELIKTICRAYKQHVANHLAIVGHQRKIATVCVRELRRGLSKTSKTNPSLKNKRINKELLRLVSKINRQEKDKIKKEDAEKEIRKKQDEALKEEMRQKRKFNYLMSQTEAFASFFLNRQQKECGGEEGFQAAKSHLANIREFDSSAKRSRSSVGDSSNAAPCDSMYVHQDVKQPTILKTVLRSYQLQGLNWLVNLYNQGINGILADDMGLGKTVQAISLLGYLAEAEDVSGPFLIISPASTLPNWENEFAKFIPSFDVVLYYGNVQERGEARKRFRNANVIVTSYQVAVSDENILKKIKWQYMILDEAQAIKSINSQRWKTLLEFKARNRCLLTGTPIQNNMQELWSLLHFIMPTLFDSLSEFSDWFLSQDGLDKNQVEKLHTILKPFMLRRHKDDIKDEIGTKQMHIIYCELSPRQRLLYNEILKPRGICNFAGSEDDEKSEYENTIMHLKKVCNHPDLFEKLEARSALALCAYGNASFVEARPHEKRHIPPESACRQNVQERDGVPYEVAKAAMVSTILALNRPAWYNVLDKAGEVGTGREHVISAVVGQHVRRRMDQLQRFVFVAEKVSSNLFVTNLRLQRRAVHLGEESLERMPSYRYYNKMTHIPPLNTFVSDSGKLSELDILLKRLKAEGHRPLVYFQMTRMMDLFEDYLVKMEYSYLRLDGSCKISTRKELVREWQTKDIFLFMLSTRAGGVGINLTAADTVVFYDSDWNPTVDQQAMDRVHRLGQTKNVSVYRLITRNSIEEKVMERANKKDEMQKMVIKGDVFEGKSHKKI